MSVSRPSRNREGETQERHERELQALYAIAQILTTPAGQREVLSEVLRILDLELGMFQGTIKAKMPDGVEAMIENSAAEVPCLRQGDHVRQISFLSVPIVVDGEAIGTLSVNLLQSEPTILREDDRVLRIVAGMIGKDFQSRVSLRPKA